MSKLMDTVGMAIAVGDAEAALKRSLSAADMLMESRAAQRLWGCV